MAGGGCEDCIMPLNIWTDAPPLTEDSSGAVRVGGTRVLLELVVRAFQDGATPESIVQRYPTVSLADAYATVAYYSRHRDEVDAYSADRERQADAVRRRIESHQGDLADIRERLLSRQPT